MESSSVELRYFPPNTSYKSIDGSSHSENAATSDEGASSQVDTKSELKVDTNADFDENRLGPDHPPNPALSEILPIGLTTPLTESEDPSTANTWLLTRAEGSGPDPDVSTTTSDPTTQNLDQLCSKRKRFSTTSFLAFLTLATLVFTIFYVIGLTITSGPLRENLIPNSESRPIGLLTILTEITGILLGILCLSTFDVIAWASARSKTGIAMSSFLAISPTTGFEGLARLFGWPSKSDNNGGDDHRKWVMTR
jgi:hypothetical protein